MNTGRLPRVLLADDHALVLEGFRKLLEREFDVVGTVADGRALLRAAEDLQPDVIIADISMPLLNGLDATRKIKRLLPTTKLILLTMHQDHDLATEAFRVGASGFLLKNSAPSELLAAIRRVLRGGTYLTSLITERMVDPVMQDPRRKNQSSKLTPRQREVLQLLAEGRSMKEAAGILKVTLRTIAFHKYRMMEVLCLKSNAELLRYAVNKHLVSD